MAVADELHGIGLGAAVVCVLVGLAKAMGKHGVELTTMQGNDAALRCYQRCGFEAQVMFDSERKSCPALSRRDFLVLGCSILEI